MPELVIELADVAVPLWIQGDAEDESIIFVLANTQSTSHCALAHSIAVFLCSFMLTTVPDVLKICYAVIRI